MRARVKLNHSMIVGIVLAGGLSSRAHTNKLTLLVDEKPIILHTINSLKPFADKIIVVTGKYDQELRPLLNGVEVIYNKDYELGMFSSVLAGLKNVHDDVVIIPGDMPNISFETYENIMHGHGLIRIPTYKSKRGHPLFLNKDMVTLLINENIHSNLKEFINKHEDRVELIPVNDPFIKIDIDTIEDYTKYINLRKEQTYGC